MEEAQEKLINECAIYVNETRKWLKFIAVIMIVSIVFLAILGILFLLGIGFVERNNHMFGELPIGSFANLSLGFAGVFYLVCAGVSIIPTTYLMRAANAGKAAVSKKDNRALVEYAKNCKSYWKFCGIVAIIGLVLTALAIMVGIIAGLAIASTF